MSQTYLLEILERREIISSGNGLVLGLPLGAQLAMFGRDVRFVYHSSRLRDHLNQRRL